MDTIDLSTQELQGQIGRAVRGLRISRGLTRAQAAAKAGIALRSFAVLERQGKSSLETFVRALKALEATEMLSKLVPQPLVSPLAMLRYHDKVPQRVRRRKESA